jgi:hypothetical protein
MLVVELLAVLLPVAASTKEIEKSLTSLPPTTQSLIVEGSLKLARRRIFFMLARILLMLLILILLDAE